MGRGKGRNSGQRLEHGSKYGGSIASQLRQYRHVSQGPDSSVMRSTVYQSRIFPTLDAIISARRSDDQIESAHGLNYISLDLPVVKVKIANRGAASRADYDDDEEGEDKSFSRAGYREAAASSRSTCLKMLLDDVCNQMEDHIADEEDGNSKEGSTGRSGIRSLSVLSTEKLAHALSGECADTENASVLGALLKESFRPEFTSILSIAATRMGVLTAENLLALNNPYSHVLALGNGSEEVGSKKDALSVAQCAAFLQSLRKSAHSPAPDDWETLSLPSHLSGLDIDIGEKGPSELFLFDSHFKCKDDIVAFQQSVGKGLRSLHLYSFTTGPASIPAFWESKRPSLYQERCVQVFLVLFLSSQTNSFQDLETLTIDHCADFRFTMSGLVSIGYAIAEARQIAAGRRGEGLPSLRTLRISGIRDWDFNRASSLCTSFSDKMGIELCALE